ncbi:myogenesis-regulating glycosidase isoform X5 [Eurytemora carolleeae]|uniref:myogenesis-regulating glycosidase isoform X5 n=1 Tax=Eurytemora carolleeae TaxID=1294199 RepID=UPI000C779B66|nr:myogenesis-regulating glycosidase isoform X5 [Eurytemora carolleeae]|eukprot:XP_023329548.1 myogenesis-regulating glycosidase-like isoform X5 [Eurytemora affinis]
MSEVLQNLFRGAGPDSGDSPITPKNNIEVLKRQFLEAEPPKYAKTTRIEFGSTTFSVVDSDSEAERTEKDETGKLLAPAEVSHYPENNGKPKTELKDQTELGEKDGEKNGLNIESLRRVTSRSSLSSTIGGIKDKISLSMPGDLKKKPEETRLRFVVLFLFLGCVSIVLTSHILYHQHIGELRLFPTVRLEEAERKMLLFDRDDRLVLTADLGVDLPQDLHPYSCIPTLSDQDNVRCIEWKDHARLHIARLDVKGLSCHRLTWQALSEHISPQDCWPVGEGAGHWYGGGESLSSRWPLDQGHINMSPFVTGDEDQTEWGNVIKKYFINSRGLSLMVEDTTPLSVSLNDQGHSGLCLKAHFDDFPYFYHRLDLPFLNYTVCSDGNLGEIYDGQLSRSFWDGHKDTDLEELSRLLQLPLWEVPDTAEGTFTLEEISAYLKTILGRGTAGPGGGDISRGFLLLNYKWQDTMGDIKLSDKLRGVDDLVSKSGLTLVLTLNPFVSTDSPNFKDGVKKGIFVMERNQNNSKNIPALTWFKDTPAAALLDVTNNDTSAWLKEKLRSVRENMNNTFFFLDTGNTFHTPHFFKFKVKLYNPDLYKEHFVKACMEEVQVIGVSGASAKRPKAPAFVHLTTLRSTWDSLRTIIPNVLNLGVIGYPFISPGPVGGKVGSPLLQIDRTKTSSSSSPNQLPQSKGKSVRAEVKPLNGSSIAEVELFTRWWQLATFLPQLHFTTAPSTYRSKNIAPIAKKLKDIKENIVNPELIRFGREAMEISRPVIRPLWMLNPTDEIAQRIDDEFLIGDKILVAPVLHENARRRNVYLPRTYNGQGVWKRGTDGTFFEGGQWLNNSIAELDTILFFIRQPEHARPGN